MTIQKDTIYSIFMGIVGIVCIILMGLFAMTGEYPRPSYMTNDNGEIVIVDTPTMIPTFIPTQPAYPEPIASPVVTEIP